MPLEDGGSVAAAIAEKRGGQADGLISSISLSADCTRLLAEPQRPLGKMSCLHIATASPSVQPAVRWGGGGRGFSQRRLQLRTVV